MRYMMEGGMTRFVSKYSILHTHSVTHKIERLSELRTHSTLIDNLIHVAISIGYHVFCFVMLCFVMLCYVMLCYGI